MPKKILYVYAPAGPPLDYCFPRIARRGEVHTCVITRPSDYHLDILHTYSKRLLDVSGQAPQAAFDQVRQIAEEMQPDVIFTFSEYLLKSVSEVAQHFGVRGAGRNVELARNKILMRERWQAAGIPQPKFVAVRSPADLPDVAQLRLPILIKVAYGAGSVGQQVVRESGELDGAIVRLLAAVDAARRLGKHEFSEQDGFPQLIAEEIIESTTASWYEEDGYGDYLSIEGLVYDGVYHPLAMTGRLRTIPPFTELGNVAPCVLDAAKKANLVGLISRAVDALQFENCATHTELKLMANGEVSFLETAARMGGVAIAKELDEVFGIDYVDLFMDVILGEVSTIPAFEANAPRCAAASVAVIACDSVGTPWTSRRTFAPGKVDWSHAVGGKAEVQIQRAQSIAEGLEVPPYDLSGGQLNYAGQAFLISRTPAELKTAAYMMLDRLEHMLPPHA